MDKKINTHHITQISLLSAISVIVGLIEIPITFLKFDFSEVIILFALIQIGYFKTLFVIFYRSVIRWFLSGYSTNIPFPFFGELIAIVASVVLITIYYLLLKILKVKLKKNIFDYSIEFSVFVVSLSILMSFIMGVLNAFVIAPAFLSKGQVYFPTRSFINSHKLFKASYNTYFKYIASVFITFNFLKYFVISIVFFFLINVIERLSIFKNKRNNKNIS